MAAKKPYVILIRDGWGFNPKTEENALYAAHPPFTLEMMETYPHVLIDASGEAVGLPQGYMGNSEVGHMTIGSGRINYQAMVRINKEIEKGSFFTNKAFLDVIKHCKDHHSPLHLIGLIQTEGVHAHLNHLYALLDLCKQQGFSDVLIHAITDGRDSPVTHSEGHLEHLQEKLRQLGFGKIATVSGRYYTMDRDKRWERTKKAYDCIVLAQAEEYDNALSLVRKCHAANETDEFILPRKLRGYLGMKDHDGVIFFNFRTDRPRQLTKAIVEKEFEGWERKPLAVHYVAMTNFYTPMHAHVAFSDISLNNLLGQVLSAHGKKQLRISETEKYAHVTFFFNGQIEKPFEGEERVLIHSPKVATYDLKPEMSAFEITDRLVQELDRDYFDVVIVNVVNGDMVGHTGVWDACIKAVLTVDTCVKKIVEKVLEKDGVALVFADHGNIEDQSPEWRTSHTCNPVPFLVVSRDKKLLKAKLKSGKGLQDVAPTLLALMGIQKPAEMTGESIIEF